MEWTSAIGTLRTTSQITLEVIGPETINGVATDKMKITVSGSGSSLSYDMWVNDAGKTVRRHAKQNALTPGCVKT